MEPDGGRNIDTITAGKMSKENLSPTRQQTRAQQDQDMPPRAGLLRRAQEIDPRAAPHGMLHQLQQLRQHGSAKAGTDSRQDHRQPEESRSGTRQGRGYHVVCLRRPPNRARARSRFSLSF
jgi:hypothetical protein